MLPFLAAIPALFGSAVKRTKSYLFGKRVRPRPGSVVHCSLALGLADHSGVFVRGRSIVELEGDGQIRCIDAQTFISGTVRTGSTIYVACDASTGAPLGSRHAAQQAMDNAGDRRNYNLILDNCHQFSSGCISGNFENADNFFWMLEHTIENQCNGGHPIEWKVWNHDDEDKAPDDTGLDEQLEEECGELDYELVNQHRIAGDSSVRQALHDELRAWQEQAAQQLRQKFAAASAKLAAAQTSLGQGHAQAEQVADDLHQLQSLDAHLETDFWHQENQKVTSEDERKPLRGVIQTEWQRTLERQQAAWFATEIARQRALLRQELDQRLKAMADIAEVAHTLGVAPGALWDQSQGLSAHTDAKALQKLADYLKNNAGVRRLAELLGRMRRQSESQRLEKIQTTTHYTHTLPDPQAKSEIIGITQGRDLEHLLPQELELLADLETDILFDLKFVESRLMSFDYAGTMEKSFTQTQEETISVTEQEQSGPMIICVDTSGSMSGEPENVAKALAMALALSAVKQKRAAYLISFSTGIQTYALTGAQGLAGLLTFLQMSFGGGTDAAPALQHAVAMLETEHYARADVLLISDFDMPHLSPELQSKMNNARDRDCKFNALNIGRSQAKPAVAPGFDAEWHYDPRTNDLTILAAVAPRMAR